MHLLHSPTHVNLFRALDRFNSETKEYGLLWRMNFRTCL